MTIFERVKKLDFLLGKYVVVGGTMEAHGLRKAKDADLVVTPEFFEELINTGCRKYRYRKCSITGERMLKGDKVHIYSEYGYGDYSADPEQIIKDAVIIQGIPFLQLEDLKKWKTACGRPKDLRDIEMINDYLRTQQNQ